MDLQMKGAKSVTSLINMMGAGIPLAMALRELAVNAIEACARNTEEESQVVIVRDHVNPKKLSVVNVGGDYLSEKIVEDHLATLGASGNTGTAGQTILEENKGIGAKIAYLPKSPLGLLYRSREKGQELGTKTQMCLDQSRGVYELPSSYCPYAEVDTSFPYTDQFSEYLLKGDSTGTEVVCMGTHEDEDTWRTFDKYTNSKKAEQSGGTGYGIFKFLTHRFWTPPPEPVSVAIYNRTTDQLDRMAKVNGLRDDLMKKSKKYGTVQLDVQVGAAGNVVTTTAHWCILHDGSDPGYRSNWASSGFTTFAWRGETYFDSNQHTNSKKSDLKQCGVIVKSDKVIVVFVFDESMKMGSNPARTELFWNDMKLDKSVFHEAFCMNMPEELREWQEQNQAAPPRNNDVKKWAAKQLKALGYGTKPNLSAPPVGSGPGAGTGAPNQGNGGSGGGGGSGKGSTPTPPPRITGHKHCKNHVVPDYNFIDDPSEHLVQYHVGLHTVQINCGHDAFKHRANRIAGLFGSACLVKDLINDRVKEELYLQTIVRLFEIVKIYSNAEERKRKWDAENLEGIWTLSVENNIHKSLHKVQKQKIALAA